MSLVVVYSQHLGGRGKQISEIQASLVYRLSFRTARTRERKPGRGHGVRVGLD